MMSGGAYTSRNSRFSISPQSASLFPAFTGKLIILGRQPLGLKGLHVSLTEENTSKCCTTRTDSACYYSTKLDSVDLDSIVLLFLDGKSGRVSSLYFDPNGFLGR